MEQTLLEHRRKRRLGPKGIQNELVRLHQVRLSTATIWHVLHRNGLSAAVQHVAVRPSPSDTPVPGDRVQIDNCKIGKGLHQFTAVDDCGRLHAPARAPAL